MTDTRVPKVHTGVAALLAGARPELQSARLGLIAHPASVTESLTHSAEALQKSGYQIRALFGPQHGMRGEKQDNMIESQEYRDPLLGVPVHSLYGDVRKPIAEMLDGLDVLLFDLQDVGTRVYTFVWTMTLAMEACRDAGVKFAVLDRPNPIGGEMVEGPTVQQGYESFVGLYPLPLRHGLTAGEIARLANDHFGIGCELDVIACEGWSRSNWFESTGLPWVAPSPNLPTIDSCVVYPGTVLLEGTNLSEGRGTTRPFEQIGAPYVTPDELVKYLKALDLPGVRWRPCFFEPTFQKHAGQLCGGAQIHVVDRSSFRPVLTAVSILHAVQTLAPGEFAWRLPPYEYEFDKMPIDILWGSDLLRAGIDSGDPPGEIIHDIDSAVEKFEDIAAPFLLYQ